MLKLYGPRGRFLSALAAAGVICSAVLFAAEQSGLFRLLPEKYAWVQGLVTAILVFVVLFSERVQGGASNPQVRHDAAEADKDTQ